MSGYYMQYDTIRAGCEPEEPAPQAQAEPLPPPRSPPWRRWARAAMHAAMVLVAVFFLALVLTRHAHAGRSCEPHAATAERIARGLVLAQRTAQALDASGARVVVLARAGQDLRKYDLRYSHLGLAYRERDGAWRVVHKLNQCGTASAGVYRQGLGEFFLDDLWRFEAAWVVPAPEVQQRLLAVLDAPGTDRLRPVNEPAYSLVSYAWGRTYQQSNQWAAETLAMAMEPATIRNRQQAQAWLQFKGYEPTVLRLGPLTRLGGRIGSAHIAFDDHPNEKRFSDRIETVTVDSVFAWLQRAGLGGATVTLSP